MGNRTRANESYTSCGIGLFFFSFKSKNLLYFEITTKKNVVSQYGEIFEGCQGVFREVFYYMLQNIVICNAISVRIHKNVVLIAF